MPPLRGYGSDEAHGGLLQVFVLELVDDAADDVAAEIKFDGNVRVLMRLVDAGTHQEMNDIAV